MIETNECECGHDLSRHVMKRERDIFVQNSTIYLPAGPGECKEAGCYCCMFNAKMARDENEERIWQEMVRIVNEGDVAMTCGECGQPSSLSACKLTKMGQELPPNMFRCPVCDKTFERGVTPLGNVKLERVPGFL